MFIYELPLSLYCFKLRLAIALKGAAMEGRAPPGGTYRSTEFHVINPAGTIPVLIDGVFVLSESDAIVDYLDDRGIGVPLLPSSSQARARTRMLSRWCDTRLEPSVRTLFPMIKVIDPGIVHAADTRIKASLALFETALDDEGPFALGAEPGLADCGLTAVSIWLSAITPTLMLSAEPGERLTRVIAAMGQSESTGPMIQAYQGLVARWVNEQKASQL